MGRYISEDPIRFASGMIALFAYVSDTNGWLDVFGLKTYSIHGNSKKIPKPNHVYVIYDRGTEEVYKFGISCTLSNKSAQLDLQLSLGF